MIKKILFDKKDRKYYWEKGDLNTSLGLIKESEMNKEEAASNTNQKFRVMTANFIDNLEKIKTGPAHTSLKDIGAILTYTGISKNSIVAEAGTGSGYLTSIIARFVKKVESYEKNEDFFNLSRKNLEMLKIDNVDIYNKDISDLKGKFDLIIFNPPYLPEEKHEDSETKLVTTGGKYGYEILERFFKDAKKFLNKNGKILIVFSSLTKKKKIDSLIKKYGFKFKLLEEKKIFFESLYVYLIERKE